MLLCIKISTNTTDLLLSHTPVFVLSPSFLGAELDDSQDSSIMTDADDTQLHTAESDDVL